MGGADAAVVAQRHQDQQALGQGLGDCAAARDQRCRGQIEDDEIGLIANAERTDAIVQMQRAGAGERGQIEGPQRRQPLALQLRDLVGLAQGAQQAEAGATADVGGQRIAQTGGIGGREIEQPAAQVQVGGGRMRDPGAALGHALAIGVVEINAMGIDRPFPQ